MPIWQLCANLLIPNCLRSNLSYSPLAALELYVIIDKTSFGPNPEHQTYFKKETVGHDFYCCTFSSFMNKLAESLDKNLPDNVKRSLKKLSYGAMIQNDES